jgi:hypothetical protein
MMSEPLPTDATESAPGTDTAASNSAQRWPARFLRTLERFFFGDDVFISYSRRDGRYATGLARELTRRELACRIDFLGRHRGRCGRRGGSSDRETIAAAIGAHARTA